MVLLMMEWNGMEWLSFYDWNGWFINTKHSIPFHSNLWSSQWGFNKLSLFVGEHCAVQVNYCGPILGLNKNMVPIWWLSQMGYP